MVAQESKEKFYLGLSFGFNSSACVISSKRGLLSAVSQERVSGDKNTKMVPFTAALRCLRIADVNEINGIAVSHYEEMSVDWLDRYSAYTFHTPHWQEAIINWFEKYGIKVSGDADYPILQIDHHVAHAHSPFGFYGVRNDANFYTITSDGFGDGFSGTVRNAEGELLSAVPISSSVGLVYQFVTGALGFKEHQHEGKITGLAAFGKPIYVDRFYELFEYYGEGNSLKFIDREELTETELEAVKNSKILHFDQFLKLKKAVYGLVNGLSLIGVPREDIAASVQEFAEKATLDWLKKVILDPGKKDAYLAGGLFANVKINQRIKDSGLFKEVYVCPAMGDEGTCVGAAIALCVRNGNGYTDDIGETTMSSKVISGTPIDGDINMYYAILNYFKHIGLAHKYKADYLIYPDAVANKIAELLSQDKIVCVMRNNMEFGPRALLHRSILYNCKSKETNTWLNDKLGRTEFMPFAPWCLEEDADSLFKNLDGGRFSSKFMTMTFDCTDEFIENYPAACHIDNTARPQIINREDDPFMCDVMSKYKELTGLKALINTSFNLHNHPIIEDISTGVDSWLKSDTDVLVIDNIVIERI